MQRLAVDPFEPDEREANQVGPMRRPARKDAGALAAQPRRLHLGLDDLVAAIAMEEEEEPHVRELFEAVERVCRRRAPF